MALREEASPTAATRPVFEGEVVSQPTVVSTPVAASTAVAVQKPAAAPIVASKGYGGNIFESFKSAIPTLEFGTVPRIVGTQGVCQAKFDGKKISLGNEIDLDLISYNEEFVISPKDGDNSEEATSKVRYSYDGVTIEGTGQPVADYIAELHANDYPEAGIKKYIQLVGVLQRVASKDAVAQKLVGKMVQISLAPQSAKSFNGFMVQKSVAYHTALRKTGTAPSTDGMDQLTVTAEGRSGKGNKEYTGLSVEGRPAQ